MKIIASRFTEVSAAKMDAVECVRCAATAAQARYLTPGKDMRYMEKQREVERWIADARPNEGNYPFAQGYAQTSGKSLFEALTEIEQRTKESVVLGVLIETLESAGKTAINSAVDISAVIVARDAAVVKLSEV